MFLKSSGIVFVVMFLMRVCGGKVFGSNENDVAFVLKRRVPLGVRHFRQFWIRVG